MKIKKLIHQPKVVPQYEEVEIEFPIYLKFQTGTMFVQLIDEKSAITVLVQSCNAEIRTHNDWNSCASHFLNEPNYSPCSGLEFFDAAARAQDTFLKLYEPLNPVKQ